MLIDSLNSLTKEFTIEFPNHKVNSDWTASYELEAHSGVMLKITGTPFECAKSITQTQYSIDFEGKQLNINRFIYVCTSVLVFLSIHSNIAGAL